MIGLYNGNVKEICMKDNFNLSAITTYQAGTAQATMHRLLQQKSEEFLKPFGITKMQWLIIGNILDAGSDGIRISDLADKLGTTKPYLTTTLKILEAKGHVLRSHNKNDSRSKLVRINPEHITTCHEIERVLREGLRRTIYDKIDSEDFARYMSVMHQLSRIDD